jgi:hypothetical protein
VRDGGLESFKRGRHAQLLPYSFLLKFFASSSTSTYWLAYQIPKVFPFLSFSLSFSILFAYIYLFFHFIYLSFSLSLSLSLSLDVFFFLFLLVLGLMACIKFMGVESRWVCFICCFMCACGVWDHDDGKMVLYPFAMLSSWVSLLFLAFFFLSWFLGFFFLSYPLDFWNFFSAFFVYFTLWFSKG